MSAPGPNVAGMDIILIPGFWLDESSWSGVAPGLEAAGHRAHPLTLPGLESRDADRSSIGLDDWLASVTAAVDAAEEPVVLVGHSSGGPLAHAAVDRRPEKVAKVVYVDTIPLPDDNPIVMGIEPEEGATEVPLPDWSQFDEPDLRDLDEDLRASFRERALPVPARVATEHLRLGDERRYDVPVTAIMCGYPTEQVKQWIAEGESWMAELARIKELELVDLPTGHWPQFTRPAELTAAILAAVK